MTEPIKWSETSDKEKIRLILTHVMGCTESDSLYALDIEKYPVAIWVDHLACWFLEEEGKEDRRRIVKSREFNPLHDMNDAWQMVGLSTGIEIQWAKGHHYYCGIRFGQDDIGEGTSMEGPAEAICVAALRACGIEVVR